jgi:threonine/homoserine/homoserine lactone efflux protein
VPDSPEWHRARREIAGFLVLLGVTITALFAFGFLSRVVADGPRAPISPIIGTAYVITGVMFVAGTCLAVAARRAPTPARSRALTWATLGTYAAGYAIWLAATRLN